MKVEYLKQIYTHAQASAIEAEAPSCLMKVIARLVCTCSLQELFNLGGLVWACNETHSQEDHVYGELLQCNTCTSSTDCMHIDA
jgi:hypothetical protein